MLYCNQVPAGRLACKHAVSYYDRLWSTNKSPSSREGSDEFEPQQSKARIFVGFSKPSCFFGVRSDQLNHRFGPTCLQQVAVDRGSRGGACSQLPLRSFERFVLCEMLPLRKSCAGKVKQYRNVPTLCIDSWRMYALRSMRWPRLFWSA